jgi:hydrogenase expression/formation protein HypC
MSTVWLELEGSPGTQHPAVGAAACDARDGCITCGDVAVELVVVQVLGADARCCNERAGTEIVATELVGPVKAGDHLLVHAGVALERLVSRTGTGSQATS